MAGAVRSARKPLPPVPPQLLGRLEFGNTNQILALREYEQQVERAEDPDLVKFVVKVEVSDSVTVWARDADEAIELGAMKLDCEPEYFARQVK